MAQLLCFSEKNAFQSQLSVGKPLRENQSALVRRLSGFAELSFADEAALAFARSELRRGAADQVFVAGGETPPVVCAVIEGLACRYRELPEGGRQIVEFMTPGDLCNGYAPYASRMDGSVAALGSCLV